MSRAVTLDGAMSGPLRVLVIAIAVVTGFALLPTSAHSQPQPVDDPTDACPDEVNPPAPFTDRMDIPEVHRLNVDCAYNNDITEGYEDSTFRPRLDVQRDQFASFLVRTLEAADVDLPEASDQGFEDIEGNVHADAINILAEIDLTEGVTETRYEPAGDLRRDQVASFIMRAAAYIEGVDIEDIQREDGPFTDVTQNNVHRENINGAQALSLVLGRTETEFFPANATKRDQMATMLVRLLAAITSEEGVLPIEFEADTLDLIPETATVETGVDHTLTADVNDADGEPLEGVDVRFEVYSDDASTEDGTFSGPVDEFEGETNAQGELEWSYGLQYDADNQIVACVIEPGFDDCQVVDPDGFTGDADSESRVYGTASTTWSDSGVDGIAPESSDVRAGDELAVNALGTEHTVSATVTDADDAPAAGSDIRFEVYRDSDGTETYTGPVESSTVTTNDDGLAAFTYTGPSEDAEDRIVICRPVRDDCLVADEDPDTDGTQFTGDDPTIGAEPNGLAGKIWDADATNGTAPTTADSASAHASGVELTGEIGDGLDGALGEYFADVPLLELLAQPGSPYVEATATGEDDSQHNTDEILELPVEPVVTGDVIGVEALANTNPGEAHGNADVTDLVVLPDVYEGNALVTAQAVSAEATTTCPDIGTTDAALATASQGTEVVDLTVLGEAVTLEPDENFSLVVEELDVIVRVGIRDVEHVTEDAEEGYLVRGLVVELLEIDTEQRLLEVIVGEAQATADCTDVPATGESMLS